MQLSNAERDQCRVEGCSVNLKKAKAYCRKHRICSHHMKQLSVRVAGQACRWCQQCAKFHPLSSFHGEYRSCRDRLAQRSIRSVRDTPGKQYRHLQARKTKAAQLPVVRASSNSSSSSRGSVSAAGQGHGVENSLLGNTPDELLMALGIHQAANALSSTCLFTADESYVGVGDIMGIGLTNQTAYAPGIGCTSPPALQQDQVGATMCMPLCMDTEHAQRTVALVSASMGKQPMGAFHEAGMSDRWPQQASGPAPAPPPPFPPYGPEALNPALSAPAAAKQGTAAALGQVTAAQPLQWVVGATMGLCSTSAEALCSAGVQNNFKDRTAMLWGGSFVAPLSCPTLGATVPGNSPHWHAIRGFDAVPAWKQRALDKARDLYAAPNPQAGSPHTPPLSAHGSLSLRNIDLLPLRLTPGIASGSYDAMAVPGVACRLTGHAQPAAAGEMLDHLGFQMPAHENLPQRLASKVDRELQVILADLCMCEDMDSTAGCAEPLQQFGSSSTGMMPVTPGNSPHTLPHHSSSSHCKQECAAAVMLQSTTQMLQQQQQQPPSTMLATDAMLLAASQAGSPHAGTNNPLHHCLQQQESLLQQEAERLRQKQQQLQTQQLLLTQAQEQLDRMLLLQSQLQQVKQEGLHEGQGIGLQTSGEGWATMCM